MFLVAFLFLVIVGYVKNRTQSKSESDRSSGNRGMLMKKIKIYVNCIVNSAAEVVMALGIGALVQGGPLI